MNSLKILFKYQFLRFLSTFKGKEKKKSTEAATAVFVVAALGILALYSLQALSMYKGLGTAGLSKVCMYHALLVSVCVLVILGVMRTAGKKKHSDEELLLSLPIKKIYIVISKQVGRYIFDFAITFVALMPYSVLYMIYEGFSVGILLVSILFILLLPLFSGGLSNICSFIISRLFNKSRYGDLLKSLSSVLIYILVFALMMLKTASGYGSVDPLNTEAFFTDRPITNTLLKGVIDQNILSIILVAIVCIGFFTVGVIMYSSTLGKSAVSFKSKETKLNVKIAKSPLKSLIKKEIAFYANCTAYVSNTIIGSIMILVLSIMLSTMGLDGITQNFGIMLPKELFVGLVILIYNFACSTILISCSSLSLEGENFWILKSSPVSTNKVFIAKCSVQILMSIPFILVGSVIVSISFGLSFLQFVYISLIPCIFSLCLTFLGLFINILLPKFQFENETQVVKQSMACLITMLVGMILGLIPIGLFFLLEIALDYIILLSLGIYVLLLIASILLLFKKGKMLYEKL